MLGLDLSLTIAHRGAAIVHGTWVPTDLGVALTAWWHPDDVATGAVASWVPRVGGPTLVQATGGAQPVKAATSFNSAYGGVTFDGADDFLSVEATTGLPTGATAGGIWASVQSVTSGTTTTLFSYGGITASSARLLRKSSTSDRPAVSDSTASITAVGQVLTIPGVLGGYWSGTTQEGRWNGSPFSSNPGTTASLATATTRTRMGATTTATATLFFNGVIRHVLVTTLLSAADRQRLEAWLAWDAGLQGNLPNDHPYKAARP